ncbi:MAG TPA: hypothetical protein VKU19_08620 [Bryobacteraceae bacterium]|nr:hypothetical protein [Bryobacteraceae bacterium]
MDPAFRKGRLAIDFRTEEFLSVLGLLRRATRLFFSTLPFLAAVTLLVYLPGTLLLQFVLDAFNVPDEGVLSIGLGDFCDLIFGALVAPAIVFGLVACLRKGKVSSISEAFRWGRRQWGKTLWNKIKVQITIALWSLFLVIPGIVATLRLIFTDVIVAVEADGEREVLPRSRELSKGNLWRILLALLPALPLWAAETYVSLRALQYSRVALAFADSFFAVLDQWMTVAILLIYLGTTAPKMPIEPAIGKRKAA